MAERVTIEEVSSLGWNSIEHESPKLTAMIHAQQLTYIGLLLVEIRDLLLKARSRSCSEQSLRRNAQYSGIYLAVPRELVHWAG